VTIRQSRAAVDLHLHTTASDGRSTPAELVAQAVAGGVRVLAATDHDTTDSIAAVQAAAQAAGVEAIAGIEITAVENSRDIHVLGYFIDASNHTLQEFLVRQRAIRIDRVAVIADRLAALGVPIDGAGLVAAARRENGRSVGRPQVAQAMIAAGHAADTTEAFDRWLGNDGPAYVPRTGAGLEAVIALIHGAGGLASLAHPGRTRIDARIEALRDAGLDALEAFHSDHDDAAIERYCELAGRLGLMVTGGSDFHGYPERGLIPGSTGLPRAEWLRLDAARDRHARH
jgi:predicted metal-dependent phosphoesterase TrpH